MSEKTEINGSREFRWPFRNQHDLVAELFCACRWQIGPDEAGIFAAKYLFQELKRRVGRKEAKMIFERVAKEESDFSEELEIRMLLFRLHLMKDKKTGKHKPNVQALARLIVAENEAFNKSPERNGRPARPTNQPSIEKQIIRIRNAHEAAFLEDLVESPQPQTKKKIARKIASAGKPSLSKRKSAQR
jgi:hypothetical protein